MEITGGEITTTGDGARAIRGFYHEGAGEVELIVRGVAIDTAGRSSYGVSSYHRGTGDTFIDVQGVSISTEGPDAYGVYGFHQGDGDVGVDVRGGSISTEGPDAYGVYGAHTSDGDVGVSARDLAIDTAERVSHGIATYQVGTGDTYIDVQGGSISTVGEFAYGIYSAHLGDGDVGVDVRGGLVSTEGPDAYGVYGFHEGAGAVGVDVRGGSISTEGASASGVYGSHAGEGALSVSARDLAIDTAGRESHGVSSYHRDTGDTYIDVQGGSISTEGPDAFGVYGLHQNDGNMSVDVRGGSVSTEGASAYGVFGWHTGYGNVGVDIRGGSVSTEGASAHGVYGFHQGDGDVGVSARDISISSTGESARGIYGVHSFREGGISIRVEGGAVSTVGARAHGVEGLHTGADALDIDLRDTTIATTGEAAHGVLSRHGGSGTVRIVIEGGSIRASGVDASGIRLGSVNEEGGVEFAAPVGEDGYRQQSVSVNAPVEGGSGGNAAGVFLAGGGKVAIGPGGKLGAASRVAILATGDAPRLRVDANLDGRRVAQVIGDNWIINDGGETTLLVNGVPLHEGATGATGAEAPNGAWDLTVPASEMVAGRIFTPGDFTENYAPRAAVYEALPGFLLRLEGGGRATRRVRQAGSPVWARVSGGRGSYEPGRSSVGASYDFRRYEAEAGMDLSMGGSVRGSFSVRHARGSADVESPHGGGEIEAKGLGVAAGLSWSGSGAYYGRGRFSLTNYEADVSSNKRGSLARDASATGHYLFLEAGRRIAMSEKTTLTPRAWASRRSLSGVGFTDAVNARVSLVESAQFTGGAGLIAETAGTIAGGALSLRASMDFESALGGADTSVRVSGEKLSTESAKNRVLLGLGGNWRKGRFSLSAEFVAGGVGSDDEHYSGRVDFGMKF